MADNLTPAQRSRTMSLIRSVDTRPERLLRSILHRAGFRFRKHVARLPGTPDVVFGRERVAVFVEGDFWHGWRFDSWKSKLTPYWRAKIERNRLRDRKTMRKLRRNGWRVVRIWEHSVEADVHLCAERIRCIVIARRRGTLQR